MNTLVATCLLLALLPLSFTLLIDLCLGYPAKDESPNTRAIFFSYSLWLAERRLKKMGMYYDAYNGFKDGLESTNLITRTTVKSSYKLAVFTTAREFFTWELGIGMCPACTNVRISILFALLCTLGYGYSWGAVIAIPCFSTLYLLIFNKLKN